MNSDNIKPWEFVTWLPGQRFHLISSTSDDRSLWSTKLCFFYISKHDSFHIPARPKMYTDHNVRAGKVPFRISFSVLHVYIRLIVCFLMITTVLFHQVIFLAVSELMHVVIHHSEGQKMPPQCYFQPESRHGFPVWLWTAGTQHWKRGRQNSTSLVFLPIMRSDTRCKLPI